MIVLGYKNKICCDMNRMKIFFFLIVQPVLNQLFKCQIRRKRPKLSFFLEISQHEKKSKISHIPDKIKLHIIFCRKKNITPLYDDDHRECETKIKQKNNSFFFFASRINGVLCEPITRSERERERKVNESERGERERKRKK